MIKKTVAIIGGNQEQTFRKIGKQLGCNVLFHTGLTRNNGTKKELRPMIQKADCVVVLVGACGHGTMDIVKELCKKTNTLVDYHQGRGATGALNLGMGLLRHAEGRAEAA